MTTEPKNELPELLPCPFPQCGGEAELCLGEHDFDGAEVRCKVCGSCTGHFDNDPKGEMASAFWNTRPAKAVQGDLDALKGALLLEFKDHIEMDMRIVNPERRTPTKKGMKAGVLICKVVDRVAAALTPESEGIAGKGDALADLAYLKQVDFHSRPSMPKDTLERYARIEAALSRTPPAQDEVCEDCQGNGEVFTHRMDCYDDLCALNGDIHCCGGVVVTCNCKQNEVDLDALNAALRSWAEPGMTCEGVSDEKQFDLIYEAARLYAAQQKKG